MDKPGRRRELEASPNADYINIIKGIPIRGKIMMNSMEEKVCSDEVSVIR